ncbi:MAG: SDR family NAD(P)-dependent oxidoreductase, partial [Opitutaceae bacterium]
IRPVEVQDLLGRSPVEIDSAAIRKAISGQVVLVTGAGGSIGSELCRQIAALNPGRLLLVEQSEAALFLIEQELNEKGFSGTITPLVADILDRPRMEAIFRRYGPRVVFHAAAHKHVFLMERQPAEAIRNNAFGSRLLAELAADHGVEAFTLISTDKAINQTNVMGATKRLAELLVMDVARARDAGEGRGAIGRLRTAWIWAGLLTSKRPPI